MPDYEELTELKDRRFRSIALTPGANDPGVETAFGVRDTGDIARLMAALNDRLAPFAPGLGGNCGVALIVDDEGNASIVGLKQV